MHGTWGGFCFSTKYGFLCKSHTQYRRKYKNTIKLSWFGKLLKYLGLLPKKYTKRVESFYWKIARENNLEELTQEIPDLMLCCEIVNVFNKFSYGASGGKQDIYIFDIYDIIRKRFLGFEQYRIICLNLGLKPVPLLEICSWQGYEAVKNKYNSGKSVLADHMREGIVVQSLEEKYDLLNGRKKYKFVSEEYLLN